MDKLPPQDIAAEEGVLGGCLIDPDAMFRISTFLRPNHFYREKHGWVYDAMLALHKRHEPIDTLTVSDELERRGQLYDVGGPASLTKLMDAVPTSIHTEYYAHIVEDKAGLRKLIGAAERIAHLAYTGHKSTEAYLESLTVLRDAEPTGTPTRVEGGTGRDLTDAMLRSLVMQQQELKQDKESGKFITWPWEPLRRLVPKWRLGQPVALIAEGGAGKTMICTNIAVHAAMNGGTVLYAATEDDAQILLLRQLALITGIPFRQIEGGVAWDEPTVEVEMFGGTLTAPKKLFQAMKSVDTWRGRLYFVDVRGKTIREALYEFSRIAAEVGQVDAVIYDWLGNHKLSPEHKGNRTEALLTDTQELAAYCTSRETRTRMLIAAQEGVKNNPQKGSSIYGAFWNSGIAHYAKLGINVHREKDDTGRFKPDIQLRITKANLDPIGTVKLRVQGETFAVYDPRDDGEVNVSLPRNVYQKDLVYDR